MVFADRYGGVVAEGYLMSRPDGLPDQHMRKLGIGLDQRGKSFCKIKD